MDLRVPVRIGGFLLSIAMCVQLTACGGGKGHGGGGGGATPPSFKLTAPNGGETWDVGSQYTVTWTVGSYVGAVDIDISSDGGSTWASLLAGTANDGSQTVTAPDLVGTKTRVKLSAADGNPLIDSLPSDASNADFTIEKVDFAVDPATFVGGPVAWGDYDGDGDLDLAIGGDVSRVRIYRNDGGAFAEVPAGIVGVQYGSLAWGDFDGDGDLDLVVAGFSGSAALTRIYRNDGGGVFTDIGATLVGVFDGSIACADFDGDGDLDLAISGATDAPGYPATTRIYRNDGGATFTDISAGLVPVDFSSLAWGDYDGDGRPDLAVAGSSGLTDVAVIYRNAGSGVFTDASAGLVGVDHCSVAWGDFDNDGQLDLALAGITTSGEAVTRVYRNSAGAFTDVGASLVGYGAVAWGDFDGDGDLDLAAAGGSGGSPISVTRIYRNDGGGVFTDMADLLGHVSAIAGLAWGDYDGDGSLDLAVADDPRYGRGAITQLYKNLTGP